MTSLVSLWLPIVLSAVFVFVVSSLIHMVLHFHQSDYSKLPDEDGVLDALRQRSVGPGQYMFPCAASMKDYQSPEMQAKLQRGPTGHLIVHGGHCVNMGKALGQWFAFCLVIGLLVAYVGGLTLAPGSEGMRVFRITATIAIMAHAFSSVPDSIWKGIRWATTWRFVFDGVLYGLTTGATFAWLWPAAA
ncbi:MAG: hypothetical protein K8J09_16450 [Planctomycetes bacterium]|nr:hypothetical protein [Planctomycetota bacterium]